MAQVGDLLRVTYCGEIFDQLACNVMYYVVSVWTGNAQTGDFLEAIADDWFATLAKIQSNDFSWISARLENLTDVAEQSFYSPISPVPGDVTTEAASPFVSLSFRQNRDTAITRNGYKRVAGIAEANIQAGKFVGGGLPTDSATNAALLMILEQGTAEKRAFPAIVGRTSDGKVDFNRINFPRSVDVQQNMTTQNTRKFGRGA